MQLILLGPPGSGKGTLAEDIANLYGIPHISTGAIFRASAAAGTPLGLAAEPYLQSGALVPDDLTNAMIKDRLSQPDSSLGFLLDGFPRTMPQAEKLDRLLARLDRPLTAVVNIVVKDETILRRLSGRRHCEVCGRSYNLSFLPPRQAGICDDCQGRLVQRADDKEEIIRQRLVTYKNQTEPLIGYYKSKGLLLEADNEGTIEECREQVRLKLAAVVSSGSI